MTPEEIGGQFWVFVSGLATAMAFWLVTRLIMPDRIKETVGYWSKYAYKYMTLTRIDITLVVTAKPPAEQMPVGEFVERSKQAIASEGYEPYDRADSIKFSMPVGQYALSRPDSQSRTLNVTFDISPDDVDDELVADGIKIRIHHMCTLRDIDSYVSELGGALELINPIMDSLGVERVAEMCLECKLKKMTNVQIMLKAMQETSIQVQVADGRGFELTENKILYYTEMISADLHKFLKRMIVAYA